MYIRYFDIGSLYQIPYITAVTLDILYIYPSICQISYRRYIRYIRVYKEYLIYNQIFFYQIFQNLIYKSRSQPFEFKDEIFQPKFFLVITNRYLIFFETNIFIQGFICMFSLYVQCDTIRWE